MFLLYCPHIPLYKLLFVGEIRSSFYTFMDGRCVEYDQESRFRQNFSDHFHDWADYIMFWTEISTGLVRLDLGGAGWK
ncbi:hypothetical protein D3C72_571840 [compost metagenome]